MDNFIYKDDKNHAALSDIKKPLPMQNTSILMFVLVFWDKLLLTEQSHLRAAC